MSIVANDAPCQFSVFDRGNFCSRRANEFAIMVEGNAFGVCHEHVMTVLKILDMSLIEALHGRREKKEKVET